MKDDVRSLFHELVDCPPGERERLFQERAIEPAVRSELESLLRFTSESIGCLTNCVSSAAQAVLSSSNEWEPARCGPYRLIRLLGSGGMGAVFLAERTDGEIKQTVAIKFLAADKRRAVWHDRFLRERQVLASLNHPSIVHVIDAGHTRDGRPYLVMEYVEGVAIDNYCAGLALRDQLELFVQVCDAVSHAHRRLIIHRDLKPSNILVNDAGQPKVLDFGIAKLLDETHGDTQTAEWLLTPSYASPEQLSGIQQTTSTDVYSLGAVLYKLLTSRSPNEAATARSGANATSPNVRSIRPPTTLNPKLPKDIDYVIGKVLRIDPEERYRSVDAFAGDIRALLESRPVQARSEDMWYRTRKFLRRYWMPMAAASMVVASLSLGLYVANRERNIAQQRFMDVRQLANKLFDIDSKVRLLSGNSKTRQFIVDTSLEYLHRLSADATHDPELAVEVANAYMRVARVQGVPISSNLGQMDQAEKSLGIADEYVRSVLKSRPSNRMAILRSAQIAHDRMLLARFTGRDDDALTFAEQSAKWLDKFSLSLNDRPEVEAVLATYMNVAQQNRMGQRFDEAHRLAKRGSEIAQSIHSKPYLGMFHWVSAGIFQRQGELEEALKAIQEAAKLLEPDRDGNAGRTMNYVLVLTAEGRILGDENGISAGRPQEALQPLRHAFELADAAVHQDASDQVSRGRLADAGLGLADALAHADARDALEVYDHVLRHLTEIQNNSSFRRYEVNALVRSAEPLRQLARAVEARQRLDNAFEKLRQLKQYPADEVKPGSEAEDALRAGAEFEARSGNIARAVEICDKLLAQVQAAKPDIASDLADAVDLSNLYSRAAAFHRRNAEPDRAAALDARRLEIWRQWDQKLPNNSFVLRQLTLARVR
jgi:serine/threonine protein kinase